MDCREIAERYYDKWLGADGLFARGKGLEFIRSPERDVKQYGYSKRFDIFALARPGRLAVSYGRGAEAGIARLEALLGDCMEAERLKAALAEVYRANAAHSVKFVLDKLTDVETNARALTLEDGAAYMEFFAAAHPGADTGWLSEYWEEMAADGAMFGAFANGRLACVADAPGMPYMADEVQEIGVATLPEHRRRGYALEACAAAAAHHIANGKCPVWSAAFDNPASWGLAEKLGFVKYADAIMLSLE